MTIPSLQREDVMNGLIVKVQCIGCKATRDINETEAREISARKGVPMCDCGMPMVAKSARR